LAHKLQRDLHEEVVPVVLVVELKAAVEIEMMDLVDVANLSDKSISRFGAAVEKVVNDIEEKGACKVQPYHRKEEDVG
jgi:hypothetical protein